MDYIENRIKIGGCVNGFKYFIFLIIIFSTLSLAEKTSVAVIDLKNAGGVPDHFSTLLSEALRAEMFKYDKFDVRNREDVKSVLEEQAFQQSGACDDNACYVRMGKVLGVQKIVTGSIGKLENTYSMTIKQIDVETSVNDKIISNRKQCTGDDLFIMIENAVKDLVRIENNKLTEPGEFKEIKEIQPQRSTTADGFTTQSDEIKEWEILGITRDEFIEYKKTGIPKEEFTNFKKSGYTPDQWKAKYQLLHNPSTNAIKSFILPGWGQFEIDKTWEWYFIFELVTWFGWTHGMLDYGIEQQDYMSEYVIGGSIVGLVNRSFSSYFAYKDTESYNNTIKQKYKLSLSPTYNPQNNGVGLEFTMNF